MADCGNPAAEQDALMKRRTKYDKTRQCIKCREKLGNVVIRHAVFCRECFFPTVITKFKRVLEPSISGSRSKRGLKASGNLCLAFSGGLGSTVLLDLISTVYFSTDGHDWSRGKGGGTNHPRNEPVWNKATVCYVEVCSAIPGARDRTEEVRAAAARYACFATFVPLRLEDAFDDEWWAKVGGRPAQSRFSVDLGNEDLFLSPNPKSTPTAALKSYLSSLPTQTAVPAAIQNLIRILLLHTARATGSSHLLLGTSLTSLSISLISSISQGSGFVVRDEASESWRPEGDRSGSDAVIQVARPLREIAMKETTMWAWWRGLSVVGKENYLGGKQGIGALTKAFIIGLERDYPSTVSTIARTCGKLAPKDASDTRCVLCERPAQPGVQAWKERISIRERSSLTQSQTQTQTQTQVTQIPPGLTPHLCYACHTTLTSRSSRGSTAAADVHTTPLPVWVDAKLEERSQRRRVGQAEMKAAIADFLLPDED
ncbi:Cytoplasmic tRNA 2-thiolation protein 2 [Mycena kentingensis (nom. inval.)]|nr:Cytoplasmic tRNA 2-thiolation protein 2 [Mycena kentingensis (nom. inval.)]